MEAAAGSQVQLAIHRRRADSGAFASSGAPCKLPAFPATRVQSAEGLDHAIFRGNWFNQKDANLPYLYSLTHLILERGQRGGCSYFRACGTGLHAGGEGEAS